MKKTPEQLVQEFMDFIGQTSLTPDIQVKYIELFAQKGYLNKQEHKSLIDELGLENKLIDKFIKTNL